MSHKLRARLPGPIDCVCITLRMEAYSACSTGHLQRLLYGSLYAINQKINVSKHESPTMRPAMQLVVTRVRIQDARTMTHYENIKHLSNMTHKHYYQRTHTKNYNVQLCHQGFKNLRNRATTYTKHECTI